MPSAASGSARASARRCRRLVRHGIGVHHAGMLPKYRRLVETARPGRPARPSSAAPTPSASASTCRSAPCCSPGWRSSTARKQRVLRTREFHQIAGRAGRAGFDTAGYVVVQAPEHVIENERARPVGQGRRRPEEAVARSQLKKPPEGTVVWTEADLRQARRGRAGAAGLADAGRQRDAGQRPRPAGGRVRVLRRLLPDNHEDRGASSSGWPGGRCAWPARWSRSGIVDPARRSRTSTAAATC